MGSLSVSQCTFWCSVLSDTPVTSPSKSCLESLNAPFGAQCFPTSTRPLDLWRKTVSMHLLVLSAFRPFTRFSTGMSLTCLNAPFGAQCFPTVMKTGDLIPHFRVSMHLLVLSAFRPVSFRCRPVCRGVSMHLLVLSAFRQTLIFCAIVSPMVSMHLLVLSAFRLGYASHY